ncbi:MAG: adenine phosphoribosyltransferase [Bdellovibrionota bacterium]
MTTSSSAADKIRAAIRDIPDYPKPGIVFKDITTVLQRGDLLQQAIDLMAAPYVSGLSRPDIVLGVEARGFIFAGAVAARLGAGFVPVRKAGKLPWKTRKVSYALEYGEDTLEIHMDAIPEKAKILIVDDLLATGGTVGAVVQLIEATGAKLLGASFLIELEFLKGRNKLSPLSIHSVIRF